MNLVFHQGALGDWVLTFPILRALAAAGPTRVVTGYARGKLAAALIPGVEAVNGEAAWCRELFEAGAAERPAKYAEVVFPPATGVLPPFPSGEGRDEGVLGYLLDSTGPTRPGEISPGAVISFISDGRDTWAENMRAVLRAVAISAYGSGAARAPRLYCIDPRPRSDWHRYVGEWYHQQLVAQGLVLPSPPDPTTLPVLDVPQLHNLNGPVAIHPGSGGLDKQWPAERFEELIASLLQRGLATQPILGEAELDRWPAAQIDRWQRDHHARVLTDLDSLLATLRGASLFIGNDAGPTHLAAQMGLPTIALFGPTDPAVWAPVGLRVTILAPPRPAEMDWLAAAEVLAACLWPR